MSLKDFYFDWCCKSFKGLKRFRRIRDCTRIPCNIIKEIWTILRIHRLEVVYLIYIQVQMFSTSLIRRNCSFNIFFITVSSYFYNLKFFSLKNVSLMFCFFSANVWNTQPCIVGDQNPTLWEFFFWTLCTYPHGLIFVKCTRWKILISNKMYFDFHNYYVLGMHNNLSCCKKGVYLFYFACIYLSV